MKNKEKITVYQPKTNYEASMLFEIFKNMNLENLDKEEFFFLFERGHGEIGFCVRYNCWQVCDIKSSELFDITLCDIK